MFFANFVSKGEHKVQLLFIGKLQLGKRNEQDIQIDLLIAPLRVTRKDTGTP